MRNSYRLADYKYFLIPNLSNLVKKIMIYKERLLVDYITCLNLFSDSRFIEKLFINQMSFVGQ